MNRDFSFHSFSTSIFDNFWFVLEWSNLAKICLPRGEKFVLGFHPTDFGFFWPFLATCRKIKTYKGVVMRQKQNIRGRVQSRVGFPIKNCALTPLKCACPIWRCVPYNRVSQKMAIFDLWAPISFFRLKWHKNETQKILGQNIDVWPALATWPPLFFL